MDLGLTGKRAIVTGGSRGIGLATARALAREGADVVIAARGVDALELAAKTLTAETGSTVVPVAVDTGDEESVRALVRRTVDELGGVDILVNSAATPWSAGKPTDFEAITDDVVREEIEIKVLGYLRTARAVAPHFVAQGWGRIVNISGLGARQANSIAQTVRNVSVAALTKNLADELGPKGVNVTVVHPGITRTERLVDRLAAQSAEQGVSVDELESRLATNSIRRIVDASEVADVVAFLASPRSIGITGDAVAVGGGAPGAVYY
ncbi:SDR family oxidoreductase [Rhodococcus triatomae]|uniref:3-oxoacyl-[acyl-carrier-protein] reductase MabA n=1 Tax=Rhodococcus triatomae TaxID=300028 RepID=A0A1G8M851_9NOCA|nr:SDR family oxidoreductase [Rhodococcus triatomae]QNG18167.1 SDR family oxidoreductase [Rhodococcus triatomae]QNG22163.1 SDR family oxidoreductase [Rhodococcus triatomae]SDI64101.1 Short-chain dehydrogenase [Rhodococcus triatomae]